MADWKTYVKAARNTARKQAPEAQRAIRETTDQAVKRVGDYSRAAGKVVEETSRDDQRRREQHRFAGDAPPQTAEEPPTRSGAPPRSPSSGSPSSSSSPSPSGSSSDWRRDAAAYATVAERRLRGAGERAKQAGIGGRIARAVRDALLIGGSLLAIWLVLSATGIPVPFSAVIVVVIVIVLISFGVAMYTQFKHRGEAPDEGAAAEQDER